MSVLERVPVERITVEAQQMRARTGPAIVSAIGLPFYLLGMLAFWVVVGSLKAVFWLLTAVKIGWVEARENAAARGVTMPVWSTGQAEDGRGVGAR